jgi:hypothetical protein
LKNEQIRNKYEHYLIQKQGTNLPDVLFVALFSVCSEKAIGVMDQTLRGRSHHEFVNNFSKKDLRTKLENK